MTEAALSSQRRRLAARSVQKRRQQRDRREGALSEAIQCIAVLTMTLVGAALWPSGCSNAMRASYGDAEKQKQSREVAAARQLYWRELACWEVCVVFGDVGETASRSWSREDEAMLGEVGGAARGWLLLTPLLGHGLASTTEAQSPASAAACPLPSFPSTAAAASLLFCWGAVAQRSSVSDSVSSNNSPLLPCPFSPIIPPRWATSAGRRLSCRERGSPSPGLSDLPRAPRHHGHG